MIVVELAWSPDESAKAYRLTLTEAETGERLFRSDALEQPRCEVDDVLLAAGPLIARLEVQRAGWRGWEDAGPEASVPHPAPGARTTLLRRRGETPVHRLTVLDGTAARILFDEPVLGTSYPLPWPEREEGPRPGDEGASVAQGHLGGDRARVATAPARGR